MKARIGVALIALFVAGVAVGAQGAGKPKEAYVMIRGESGERVSVTVNVPGKKQLNLVLRGLPDNMVVSYGGKFNEHTMLIKDVRLVRIDDEER